MGSQVPTQIKHNNYTTTPQMKQTIEALWRLEKIILDTLDFKEVVQKIVTSVLTELGYLRLGYRIVVLALVDKKERVLKRISYSQTKEASEALKVSPLPFHKIDIPLTAKDNLCIKVLETKRPSSTTYWPDILTPPFSKEAAVLAQKAAGIKTSLVYPVTVRDKTLGIIIFSMVKKETEISPAEKDLIRGFTDVVGLAVQNAKLYSSLEETTEKLKQANKRLQEVDKLKDEFVSIASHELRTPMTAIKSYLWMVLYGKRGNIDDQAKKYLERVYLSTERLINLVNDMLDVSRIESGRIELHLAPVAVAALLASVKRDFQAKAKERKLEFEIEVADDIDPMMADKERIYQVVENLIGNALKFTPSGGKITISAKQTGSFVEIAVSDTGKGIRQEDIPKLFKKFGRLDNSLASVSESGGTGLGLYICKQYVKMHQGKIWVKSKLGKGSTFIFRIPVYKGKGKKEAAVYDRLILQPKTA